MEATRPGRSRRRPATQQALRLGLALLVVAAVRPALPRHGGRSGAGMCALLPGMAAAGPQTAGSYTYEPTTDLLGSGAYAKVFKCRDPSGNVRALKQFFTGDKAVMDREVEVHRQIGKHPNAVEMIEAVDVEGSPGWKMIVMGGPDRQLRRRRGRAARLIGDLAPRSLSATSAGPTTARSVREPKELAQGQELGDMLEQRGKLSEAEAKPIFKQLVNVIQHLHSQNVLHRDLKPDNIFVGPNGIKLIDFGSGHWAKDGPLEASKFIGRGQGFTAQPSFYQRERTNGI
ncbi:unnamed protein product [Prorocentrum cordatum]|uniref:Protein kinase domain-containing protein n=1 Tax=Prorocentrum cordatum TaxID=2364126 RepID=A0ABN9VMV3_9DINO|nr:unnamed protein product [Polarella glacialis]